ncbi:hypothetical protein ACMHYB_33050 [Sorangium sp. So ce1128]
MRCRPTEGNVEEPYYRPQAPSRSVLIPPESAGPTLRFTGNVLDTTCCPIPGVEIDVWQADAEGRYDNDDPRSPPPRSKSARLPVANMPAWLPIQVWAMA